MILPEITPLTAPYWAGAREGKLRLQSCRACANVGTLRPRLPPLRQPRLRMDRRGGNWPSPLLRRRPRRRASGRQGKLPLVVALVRLAEGPLFLCNLLGCAPEDVRVEMPVRLDFEALTPEIVLPQFRPVD